jgi:hypothetical protein
LDIIAGESICGESESASIRLFCLLLCKHNPICTIRGPRHGGPAGSAAEFVPSIEMRFETSGSKPTDFGGLRIVSFERNLAISFDFHATSIA